MKSLFLVLLVAVVAFAELKAPDFTFNTTGGLNITDAARLFVYRNTSLEQVVIRGKTYNAFYGSCIAMDGTKSDIGGGMIIGDAAGDKYNFYVPPAMFGFHYTTQNSIDYLSLARMVFYGLNPEDPVYKTFIALAVPGVVEIDRNGGFITSVSFNCSGLPKENQWTPLQQVDTKQPGVTAYTTTMKAKNNAEFRITMLVSNSAGILKYGYTPVTPTGITYVVEIDNWPYKSPYYRLALVLGSAIEINGGYFKDNYTSREDGGDLPLSYVNMPGYAVVDKQIISVSTIKDAASIIRKSPLVVGTDVVNEMSLMLFNSRGQYKFRAVTFPETARNMVYGTVVGAGAPVYAHVNAPAGTYSAASSVILSLVAALIALVLVF